jgi:hypothetical protein
MPRNAILALTAAAALIAAPVAAWAQPAADAPHPVEGAKHKTPAKAPPPKGGDIGGPAVRAEPPKGPDLVVVPRLRVPHVRTPVVVRTPRVRVYRPLRYVERRPHSVVRVAPIVRPVTPYVTRPVLRTVTKPVPRYIRVDASPRYWVESGPTYTSIPGVVVSEDAVPETYTYAVSPWKVCQVDARYHGYVHCGTFSYGHGYGGYRTYGGYKTYGGCNPCAGAPFYGPGPGAPAVEVETYD